MEKMNKDKRRRSENNNDDGCSNSLLPNTIIKRQSSNKTKKPKTEALLVSRRSLRIRGVSADGLKDNNTSNAAFRVTGTYTHGKNPVSMGQADTSEDGSGRKLIDTINKSEMCKPARVDDDDDDAVSMQLKPDHIAKLLAGTGRIMSLIFYPTIDIQMVVAGNKHGHVGFWNLNANEKYVYHPHPGPISGIVVDPFSISKMYSSCCEGFIRLMDVEKQVFDMVYYSENSIFSISLSPRDQKSLYYGDGVGGVGVFDVRAGKSSSSFPLHKDRISTIDNNLENDIFLATSSNDGTACIWDVRSLSADKPKPLKTVKHKRAVHSAYFSPTGKFLATTSVDDTVGIASGANYENASMVYHENHTNHWISKFRGIWGWGDSSIFIGNMDKGVDVISVAEKSIVDTFKSDLITAIPCCLAPHPHTIGTLAGATAGGQVYVWTGS